VEHGAHFLILYYPFPRAVFRLADVAAVAASQHWERPLLTGDTALGQCTLAAVHFALTRASLASLAAERACLRLRCVLLRMAAADLKQVRVAKAERR
jgi:hypothetical protein